MFETHHFTANGLRLSYVAGPANGPPLVFFHGVTRCWQDLLLLYPALALRHQLFGLDFRGHGGSERAPGRYRVTDYVEDAVAFLRSEVPAPAVVYGHSLGGLVACSAAAAAAPERVQAVILEDPPLGGLARRFEETPFQATFSGMRAALAEEPRTVPTLARRLAEVRIPRPGHAEPVRLGDVRDGAQLRFGARCLLHLDPEVLDTLLAGGWMEGFDEDGILPRVPCPALLLVADVGLGGILAQEDATRVANLLRDCTRVDLPEVGHQVHWLQPELTLRLVTAYLESL